MRDKDPDHNLYKVDRVYYLKVQIRGETIRESLRTENRSEARPRRDARLAELRGEHHSWPVAVGKWLAEYLPDNVDGTTAKRYEVSIGQIKGALVTRDGEKILLEEMAIERITLKTISEVVSWSKTNRPGVSHATIRRDLTALSSVLHATCGWGWRLDNPAKNWDRTHIKERRDPIYLPPDHHIEAVIAHSPPIWGKAVRFLAETGMRLSEAFYLRRDQISADKLSVTLRKTKNNRVRVVPLNEVAVGILAGILPHRKSNFVFWHGMGEEYRNVAARHIQIRSKEAVTKTAGEPVTFSLHHLRHRYAVRYLQKGGNIYDLQAILGHSTLKVTEIYLDHLDPETKQRAIRRVSK